jgi:hypothetical protein
MPLTIGDEFPSIHEAASAMRRWVIDCGESYTVSHSNWNRYILECLAKDEQNCDFTIRAYISKGRDTPKITVMRPHQCSPATHNNFHGAHSVEYLKEHYRPAVVDNRAIAPRQIVSSERIQFANRINYMQAFRTREALRTDIEGDEGESFSKFSSMINTLLEADPHAFCDLQAYEGRFTRCMISPGAVRAAVGLLRPFIALGTLAFISNSELH